MNKEGISEMYSLKAATVTACVLANLVLTAFIQGVLKTITTGNSKRRGQVASHITKADLAPNVFRTRRLYV